MADLSIEIAGLTFKNTVWLASGEPTESFEKMKLAFDKGAGACVAKSWRPGIEHDNLTNFAKYMVFGYDRRPVYGKDIPKFYTAYSRTGTILGTEDAWMEELEKTHKYAKRVDAHVIGSVFGAPIDEMVRISKKMEQIGLDAIELDVGCPHPDEGLFAAPPEALLRDAESYHEATKAVVDSVSIPVFIKLSPQQSNLVASAGGVKQGGGAGVTCHNRFLGFMVDIDNAKPYIWGWGGVGGPWMLPIALRWVSKIHNEAPDFPILASSGPYDWEDVVRFHMAGAYAVQWCSTVMAKGYNVITDAILGMDKFLDTKGYKSVRDIIGVATQASYTYDEMKTLPEYREKASFVKKLCNDCGKCDELCWYGAVEHHDGYYQVIEEKCKGCRSCLIACPIEGCVVMSTVG
ncbi:tRNA-dihydrouridine synthase [Thermodesulfobacteriota bacterium]